MGGQSAPHKRGGTHRVKDEDKTNSKYDEYKYQQLKDECIARKIYVKDMKKVEMAKRLVAHDYKVKRAEHEAAKERQRKQQQLQREKAEQSAQRQRAYAGRQRRRRQKEEKRQREESVSDDTPDEEELQMMKEMFGENSDHGNQGIVGQALSDESWQSTSTESASCYANPVILPGCKLRLFEWMYEQMPSPTARSGLKYFLDESFGYWDDSKAALMTRSEQPNLGEVGDDEQTLPVPHNVPYAPIKVYTTESKEKVFFPGQTYPKGIDANYVPILSERTRRAARNGILEGVLRCATIEPATAWLERTRLQGWNAQMFFTLPPANEAKTLPDVYRKFVLENYSLLNVKPRGDAKKGERIKRHTERRKNKAQQQAEVYEASKYRPTAVCYLPAYLDFHANPALLEHCMRDEVHDLSHLFYIRFPGCDVPHYYFWTRTGEWADPTTSNPNWDPELADGPARQAHLAGKHLPGKPEPARQFPIRIRRAIDPSPPASPLSQEDLTATISRIEHELYTDGLKSAIYQYRTKWRNAGRPDAWEVFGRALPLLYPSGALPTAPPVHAKAELSVASKIANVELGHAVETFKGDEPWTSRDDEWWDVIIIEGENGESVHSHTVEQDLNDLDPKDLEALYRRASVQMPYSAMEACEKWLEDVKPEYIPLSPDNMSDYREEWEAKVFDHGRGFSHVNCPVCMLNLGDLNIEDQAQHITRHSIQPPLQNPVHRTFPNVVEFNNQIDHRFSTAVNLDISDVYDAGAEADRELSASVPHTSPRKHKNRRRSSAYKAIIEQASSSHLYSLNKGSKRTRTALDFLDAYAPPTRLQTLHQAWSRSHPVQSAARDSLNRKSSVPTAPAPTHKKRRRIADPTYRAPKSSEDMDEEDGEFVPEESGTVKKRRRIADPKYGDVGRGGSSEEDVREVRSRKRKVGAKKRRVVSKKDGMQVKGEGRYESAVDEITEITIEGQANIEEDMMEMDVDGQVQEGDMEEDVVAVKSWCIVM